MLTTYLFGAFVLVALLWQTNRLMTALQMNKQMRLADRQVAVRCTDALKEIRKEKKWCADQDRLALLIHADEMMNVTLEIRAQNRWPLRAFSLVVFLFLIVEVVETMMVLLFGGAILGLVQIELDPARIIYAAAFLFSWLLSKMLHLLAFKCDQKEALLDAGFELARRVKDDELPAEVRRGLIMSGKRKL